MKKFLLATIILASAVSLSLLSSCRLGCVKGSGNQQTQNNKVAKFDRITISGPFHVKLKQDSSMSVSITADDNFFKYIRVNSDDGTLSIKTRKSFCGSGEVMVNIGVGNLSRIEGDGAVTYTADGKLTTGDLKFELNGKSTVDLDLNAANVVTEGNGLCDVTLRGQATSHKVEMNGKGTLHAFDFVVSKYDINATGKLDGEVNVLNELNVNSTGASDIQYKGNPSSVNTSKMGASTVTKVN
ncbi:MAG TPA: head GIN domain-containing protein [Mucilaginibacter sp.]|jgi:hypothetical protein|nr:head GIN domain-containing protein [Mucilaginibacter sp.]